MATHTHPRTAFHVKPPPWNVGEIARRTGMSVRALHHYDEIGLLRPSLRTPSGHRLYDTADIQRLQQIQPLRLMGLSLDEVKRLLDGAIASPRQVVDLHLARRWKDLVNVFTGGDPPHLRTRRRPLAAGAARREVA